MPSIWKRLSHPKVEPFQFPDAKNLREEEEAREESPSQGESPDFARELQEKRDEQAELAREAEEARKEEEARLARETAEERSARADEKIKAAEELLEEAQAQAETILEEARAEAELLRENARTEGLEEGRKQGLQEGREEALSEARAKMSAQAEELTGEVEHFLTEAQDALDRQMDESVGELRDLAIAVAEKVIGISLESSSEVIERMIRMAVDKRKRKEWAQIYVSEKDARRLMPLSSLLTASLSAFSQRVKILPMSDDEPGVCIIETPDEIIDASVSTQLDNIRSNLEDVPPDPPSGAAEERFHHVSEYDPTGAAFRRVQPDR